MPVLAIPYPGIDPVAFSVGPFDVRWYGLAYAAGLIAGWLMLRAIVANRGLWGEKGPPFAVDRVDDLVFAVFVAGVAGGRLGQVLLYELPYFAANPTEIVKVWKGGMSFHGGIVGAMLATVWFARRHGVPVRTVMDLTAAAMPFGILLGRIANFVNHEHWGRVSDVPWAMVFPDGGPLPRHPSQLYEAGLEGLLALVVVGVLIWGNKALQQPGRVAGSWLVWYAVARVISEFFREPEAGHWLNLGPFTAGQLYSIPVLLLGVWALRGGAVPARSGEPGS